MMKFAAKPGYRLEQIIAVGLVVCMVFAALAHGAVEPWSVAVLELMIVGLLLLWGFRVFVAGRLTISVPAFAWPLIGLTVLGLVQSVRINGSALSRDVEATRMVTLLLACLTIATVMAATFLRGQVRLQRLLNFLTIYGLALAVFGLLQHFSWNGRLYWLRPLTTAASSPFGPFVNHNHFAGYLEMLTLLPVALLATGAVRREKRLFYLFAAAMMGLAVIVSLSRGGMLALGSGAIFLLALSIRNNSRDSERPAALRHLAGWGAVAALLLAIVIGILWLGADPIIERVTTGQLTGGATKTETFYSSRGWIWKDTLAMILARPVTGVGLGAYETVYPNYSQHDSGLIVDKAHNDYLQLLAEGGLIAGLLALWFLLAVFRSVAQGMQARDPWQAAIALGSGAGISALLVHSFFDFNLQLPSNALLFLLLAVTAAQAATVTETARASVPAQTERLRAGNADFVTGVSS